MLDVMQTHSALGHGLERLLSGSGLPSSSSSNTTNQQQQHQHQYQQQVAEGTRSNLSSPSTTNLSPQTANLMQSSQNRKESPFSLTSQGASAAGVNQKTSNMNQAFNLPPGLMRKEKQQQLIDTAEQFLTKLDKSY
jgi:hypothetical protein